jgi:hypothetical protein
MTDTLQIPRGLSTEQLSQLLELIEVPTPSSSS